MSVSSFGFVASCFVFICFANADPVSFINKCAIGDSKCTKDSAQAAIPTFAVGIPELKVTSMDPMHLDKVDASSNNLKLFISDVTITGLKGCSAKKMQLDQEKEKLFVKIQCDVNLNGQYEMDGQLLVLPIKGKGAVHAKLRKLTIHAEADVVGKDGKDGKKHLDIKRFNHSFELKDKSDINFEGLFEGNEVLGRAARELITNNGNDIVNEVGSPIIKTVITKIVSNVNRFFSIVPIEDLTL